MTKRGGPGRALVVGRFLPPGAGHHRIIDLALASGWSVDVVVLGQEGERPGAGVRTKWLTDIHPDVAIHTVTGDETSAGDGAWGDQLRRLGSWDSVIAGPGDPTAVSVGAALGIEVHVTEIAAGLAPPTPTASSALDDLAAHWSELHPVVRAGLTRRIVVLGAESTGTTTLAMDLAAALDVPWVPEQLRHHAEVRAEKAGSIWDVRWTAADFDQIAEDQDELERAIVTTWVADAERSRPGAVGPVVVCDTDALATAVWARRYLGAPAPRFARRAADRPPARYVMTTPDGVAFHQDGLRDGEHLRESMTAWFRTALRAQDVPWIEVTGDRPERLALARRIVAELADEPVIHSGGSHDR